MSVLAYTKIYSNLKSFVIKNRTSVHFHWCVSAPPSTSSATLGYPDIKAMAFKTETIRRPNINPLERKSNKKISQPPVCQSELYISINKSGQKKAQ